MNCAKKVGPSALCEIAELVGRNCFNLFKVQFAKIEIWTNSHTYGATEGFRRCGSIRKYLLKLQPQKASKNEFILLRTAEREPWSVFEVKGETTCSRLLQGYQSAEIVLNENNLNVSPWYLDATRVKIVQIHTWRVTSHFMRNRL